MRHRLTVVLALTACAVPAGATSLLAVGEWITDAPEYVLEQVGARPDPLLPRRVLPAETTVRRLLVRIDGDALDRAVGSWLADPQTKDGRGCRAARPGRGRQEPTGCGQGKGPEGPSARGAGAHHRPGHCPVGRRGEDQRVSVSGTSRFRAAPRAPATDVRRSAGSRSPR
ncbi:transposase family protein [Streptomyces sp. NBC_00019]|uniref:transposase family protein n=1 Tax=Streptomyces sp. NBC_00019 TaxID=2975623 RepID=UPI00324A0606